MGLVKWDPFHEMTNLQHSINKLFDDRFLKSSDLGLSQGWAFPVDIKETADSIVIKAEMPGLTREDVKITFSDNLLTIRGQRQKENKFEGERYLRVERSYGNFSRTFNLDFPVKAEEIKARFQDGILEVLLPKKEEAKPKEITIDINQ